MLIQQGLNWADDAGAKAFVEASEVGVPLYSRFGFEVVDEVVVDLEGFGGREGEKGVMKLLIRKGRKREVEGRGEKGVRVEEGG